MTNPNDDVSPGGQPIYRHTEQADAGLPPLNEGLREAIAGHLDTWIDGEPWVLSEIVSEAIKLDLFIYPPTPEREVYTIVTCGMSEAPMTVPEGAEEWNRCELVLLLPADWPVPEYGEDIAKSAFTDDKNYWPIRAMKEAAHLPRLYDTWLTYGHTIATDDGEPYAGTDFTGLLVGPEMTLDEGFDALEYDGNKIWFWGLYPLYSDEMEFKLAEGAEALFERMFDKQIPEGVWLGRPSLA